MNIKRKGDIYKKYLLKKKEDDDKTIAELNNKIKDIINNIK